MKNQIQTYLKQLEKDYNIKILFACEAGSRAWGVASPNSDHNIRIIYIRPLEWYLSIKDKPDYFTISNNDQIDIEAWDFKKALSLLSQSNTILIEWLQSPRINIGCPAFFNQISDLSKKYFLPRKSIYHYLGLSNALIKKHFEKETIPIKKYFMIMRSMLASLWIKTHQSPVPVAFSDLLSVVEDQPKTLLAIHQLMRLKKETKEGKPIKRIDVLDQFIFDKRKACSIYAESLPKQQLNDLENIDTFFRGVLIKS